MTATPQNPLDPQNPSPSQEGGGSSVLASILATVEGGQLDSPRSEEGSENDTGVPETPSLPPKKPVDPKDFFRFIGAIVGVGLIVFGSFLAYVVFNPEQAQFFISLGINPADIQNFLRQLVTIIFGGITAALSIAWMVILFKAILTKKEYKKTKTIFTILSIFVGLILFSEITLWAYLYKVIGASDYANSTGSVVIYDNSLLNSKQFADKAQVTDFSNIVGPVTLRFDFASNARQVSKKMNIQGYKMDFDGDGVIDIDKPGVNPGTDLGIFWTFGESEKSSSGKRKQNTSYGKGSYNPVIIYDGTDKMGKPTTAKVDIGTINVIGSVIYKEVTQPTGGKRVAIDASEISNLGRVEWYTSRDMQKPDSIEYRYAPDMVFKDEDSICLKLATGGSTSSKCNRIFVIGGSDDLIRGKITHKQDSVNPFLFTFRLEGLKSKAGIKSYSWRINDGITPSDASDFVEYTFLSYGKQKVTLEMEDYAGNSFEFVDEFVLMKPLKLVKLIQDNKIASNSLLKVFDVNGNSLINDTYDNNSGIYNITDLAIPQSGVTFNALSVRVTDPKYDLLEVEWDFDGDGKYEQKGKVVKYNFLEERKYTVVAHYTFSSNEKGDIQNIDETMIFDGKKKEIVPRIVISPESEYAPTVVKFDASASEVKDGSISKFTYDFGEGKAPVDGDAQMQYRYILGGEYIVKLTVTKNDGTKESIARRLVLKDGSKNVLINASVSSGFVGRGIDFDAAGSAGQITEYSWDFGDGGTSTEARPTHIFQTPGTYTVSLKVSYLDGTLKDTTIDMVIKDPSASTEPIPE